MLSIRPVLRPHPLLPATCSIPEDITDAIEGDLSGCAPIVDLCSVPDQYNRCSDVRDLLIGCVRHIRYCVPYAPPAFSIAGAMITAAA